LFKIDRIATFVPPLDCVLSLAVLTGPSADECLRSGHWFQKRMWCFKYIRYQPNHVVYCNTCV